MKTSDLKSYSREQIQKGSKSFSLASFFLEPHAREGAWLLYSWCRYCDDQIDQASPEEALTRLKNLKDDTQKTADGQPPALPEYQGLLRVFQEWKVSPVYAFDLLRGMEMDVLGSRIRTERDLEDYCYSVAGVVGLMMSQVMGVADPLAHKHAVALGMAMQMTNIARDVRTDLRINRVYLPDSWLLDVGLDRSQFALHPKKWILLTERLLKKADIHYQMGRAGFKYLPTRSRWAIAVASSVYEAIGAKVSGLGLQAWSQRTYVSLFEKLVIVFKTSTSLVSGRWVICLNPPTRLSRTDFVESSSETGLK